MSSTAWCSVSIPGVETSTLWLGKAFPRTPDWAPHGEAQLGSSWPRLGTAVSVLGPSDVASRGVHLCWHLLAGRLCQVFPASWLIPAPFGWATALALGCLHIALENTVGRMASLTVTELGLSHPTVARADFWGLNLTARPQPHCAGSTMQPRGCRWDIPETGWTSHMRLAKCFLLTAVTPPVQAP